MKKETLKTTAYKVLKVLLSILLSGLIVLNLLTIIFTKTGLSEKIRWLPFAVLSVESGSMEPEIQKGDLILIKSGDYHDLAVGDNVTYYRNGGFVTHKIIRREGSRFVTKGLANRAEDSSIGPQEYIGKVLKVFPKMGSVTRVLTSVEALVLMCILLLVIFFGRPVFTFVYDRISKEKSPFPRPTLLRILGCIAAASLVLTAPCVTEAKYVAFLNEYDYMVANSNFFACDYLAKETQTYMTRGWNGSEYSLEFDIANYENLLLYNTTGHDMRYMLSVEKIASDGETTFNMGYDIWIEPVIQGSIDLSETPFLKPDEWREPGESNVFNPATAGYDAFSGPYYGPFLLEGNDFGGIEHTFRVCVRTYNGLPLGSLEQIRFVVTAVTAPDETYFHHLSGEFTMEVEEADSFFRDVEINSVMGNALVNYSLKTNLIDGEATKKVILSWDPELIYLNEVENTAFSLLASDPQALDREHGKLTIYLQAYTELSLQFFKRNPMLSEDQIKINARAEVNDRVYEPEETSEESTESGTEEPTVENTEEPTAGESE